MQELEPATPPRSSNLPSIRGLRSIRGLNSSRLHSSLPSLRAFRSIGLNSFTSGGTSSVRTWRSQKLCLAVAVGLTVLAAMLAQAVVTAGAWESAKRRLWYLDCAQQRQCSSRRLDARTAAAAALTASYAQALAWEDVVNGTSGPTLLTGAAATLDAMQVPGAVLVARQSAALGDGNASAVAASESGWVVRRSGGGGSGCVAQGRPSDWATALAGCGGSAAHAAGTARWPPCAAGEPLRCSLSAADGAAGFGAAVAAGSSPSAPPAMPSGATTAPACALVVGNASALALAALLPCDARCHSQVCHACGSCHSRATWSRDT